MQKLNWALYPNFTEAELACRHTGKCLMKAPTMKRLQRLRNLYKRPMRVSSGYRDFTHPIEARKSQPGPHTTGQAVDISVWGTDAYELIFLAMRVGFTGIGVQQKGETRFVHLDDLPGSANFPRPWVWSY